KNEEYRTQALSALSDKLSSNLWQYTLHRLSQSTRPYFLQNTKALVPAIISLGGHKTIVDIFYAIQDVTRWWK
ncbi:MAG: hypothetical protein AAF063_13005, partial [Cyanobacteria bacterium J06643_5]